MFYMDSIPHTAQYKKWNRIQTYLRIKYSQSQSKQMMLMIVTSCAPLILITLLCQLLRIAFLIVEIISCLIFSFAATQRVVSPLTILILMVNYLALSVPLILDRILIVFVFCSFTVHSFCSFAHAQNSSGIQYSKNCQKPSFQPHYCQPIQ